MIDDVPDAVFSPECLAAVRLLLLSVDAASPSTSYTPSDAVSARPRGTSSAGVVMTCDALRHCLLLLADVLVSAGTHVYLLTVTLHRAMSMMVALATQLNASQGQSAAAACQ